MLLLWAAGILTWCSDTSPLYLFRPTEDPAIFLICGKGILHGLLPYADMADTKGPLWLLVYTLIAWFDGRSFLGVFLLQCLTFWLTLCLSYKTSRFYLSSAESFLAILLLTPFFFVKFTYVRGGGVEEFYWPVVAACIYAMVRYFRTPDRANLSLLSWLLGLSIGSMWMIKFSIAFPFMGLCVLLYVRLWRHGDKQAVWYALRTHIIGCLIPVLPCMVWLWSLGVIPDFVDQYLLAGARYGTVAAHQPWWRVVGSLPFSSLTDVFLWSAVIGACKTFGIRTLKNNPALVFTVVLYVLFKVEMLSLFLRYYNSILAPMLIWAAIYWAGRITQHAAWGKTKNALTAVAVIAVMAVLMYTDHGQVMWRGHFNIGVLARSELQKLHPFWQKDSLPTDSALLSRFEGAKCLYLGYLDNGDGIPHNWLPCGRYWFLQNFASPAMRAEQFEYIKQGKPDIIYNHYQPQYNAFLQQHGYTEFTTPRGLKFWCKQHLAPATRNPAPSGGK